MSAWRREASERLPEFQRIIASRDIDGPMALWIELNSEFGQLCGASPPPLDLLTRIWRYAEWCLAHENGDVSTAAALAFCEHLIDTPARTAVLPKLMKRGDFLGLREILEYHHGSAKVERCLALWQM